MTRTEFDKAAVDVSIRNGGKELHVAVRSSWMGKTVITAIKTPGKPTVTELRDALNWLEVGCIDKVPA
jgi:hypothetical protein